MTQEMEPPARGGQIPLKFRYTVMKESSCGQPRSLEAVKSVGAFDRRAPNLWDAAGWRTNLIPGIVCRNRYHRSCAVKTEEMSKDGRKERQKVGKTTSGGGGRWW